MVKVKKDLTGQFFGRLTVVQQVEDYIAPGGRHMDQWLCECSCEEQNRIIVKGVNLRNGNTKSCGCFRRERITRMNKAIPRETNSYDLSGEYGVGWTINTKRPFYFDLEDYDKIKKYYWYERICDDGYHRLHAYISETGQEKTMAQIIMGNFYDHEDRNPLNNRKCNLRPSDKFQNAQNHNKQKNNTSGFIGVGWHKMSQKWYAEIQVEHKDIWLGLYNSKEDAIRVRLQAEAKYFGKFAPQKHLFKQYKINEGDEQI